MEDIENQFAYLASLLGERSRALMLWSLLDGRAYTATELAICANISPQAASNHLVKLVNAQLLSVEKQGRHRYYRYHNDDVAQAIESLAGLIPNLPQPKLRPIAKGITYARTCYDHLAGKAGVQITEGLIAREVLKVTHQQYIVTDTIGKPWFQSLNIDVDSLQRQKRSFARKCLDWSERKHHLAGSLGAALLQVMLNKQWVRKKEHSREVVITQMGKMALEKELGIIL
ncbi:hypothetical protein BKI52_37945 [marine bacterium AO1-C]|nr:hypothetical protein BKI52_37945 [marine bacterium AO1-C]